MVDEKLPELIDHLGWRLWRAARLWKAEFDGRMTARGGGGYAEGRAALAARLGAGAIRQRALVHRWARTKRALQQIVDDWAAGDTAPRRPDPADNRGRIITLTPKGVAAAHAANEVKREIDAAQRERLGAARFEALMDTLRTLAPDAETPEISA